jgi:hypothetical protein
MTAKRKALVAAAAIHLALAAVYAGHIPAEVFLPRQLDRWIGIYGSFSGVRHHFDFFAPSVSTQARVSFRIFAADGSVHHVYLATPSSEANNRIALMLTFYAYADSRDTLLREWARFMLRSDPRAVAVESRIEALEIPPLAQIAKDGAQPRWVEMGRTTVRKGDEPAR